MIGFRKERAVRKRFRPALEFLSPAGSSPHRSWTLLFISRLPFFGRAYSIPYGGGDGLMFEAKLKDYTCRDGKRGRKEIGFTADTDEDHFEFRLTVFPDGSSSVSVVSTNRQQISYGGTLSKIKKSDKKGKKSLDGKEKSVPLQSRKRKGHPRAGDRGMDAVAGGLP